MHFVDDAPESQSIAKPRSCVAAQELRALQKVFVPPQNTHFVRSFGVCICVECIIYGIYIASRMALWNLIDTKCNDGFVPYFCRRGRHLLRWLKLEILLHPENVNPWVGRVAIYKCFGMFKILFKRT